MNKLTVLKSKFGINETETAEKVYEKAGHEFLNCVPENKLNEYAEEMLEYFTTEQFISMLFYATQKEEIVDYGKLARKVSKLCMFQSKPKEIKTVATFYFRMHNGGAEKVISMLGDMWARNGYRVILFTDTPPNENDYYINDNIIRVVLPANKWQDAASFEERSTAFREYLKKYSVDVMVYHAWNNYNMVADAMTVKSLGIPFVVYTHGVFCIDAVATDWWCAYASGSLHKVYSLCDLVVALNKSDCAYWKALGLKCVHSVNPAGIPLDTKQAELSGKNIVMVCRISVEKQVLDGIKIIQEVNKRIPEATLTIVGDGDDTEYVNSVKSYIKDHNLENIVNMTGFKKDVVPYYLNSDVFLMVSIFEGAPMTIVESKICGLPLVSYNIPNLDTLREGKGVFVVPQNDIRAAADKIVEILSDSKLKKEMGQAARQSVEEMYSIDIAKHWDYIFKQGLLQESSSTEFASDDVAAAIRTLIHYTSQGIKKRSIGYTYRIAKLENELQDNKISSGMRISELEKILEDYGNYIKKQDKALEDSEHYVKSLEEALKKSDDYVKNLEKALDSSKNNIETLENTVKEIRSSTSYRLGWFLTTIPRKINDFIKGQKYVE